MVGGGSVAAADAVTFLVAAAMVSRLRLQATTRPEAPHQRWLTELTAGVAHIRATHELRWVVIAATGVIGVFPASVSPPSTAW